MPYVVNRLKIAVWIVGLSLNRLNRQGSTVSADAILKLVSVSGPFFSAPN